ncbi:PAS domain S-box protein [Candidatus Dojkabacteria bacterium]|nr:PAS domain S-box protein [Candidatus Dojkabacteria bacterium]
MNTFNSILPVIAIICVMALLGLLFGQKKKNAQVLSLIAALSSSVIWLICDFMLINVFNFINQALLYKVTLVFAALSIIFLMHFFISYSRVKISSFIKAIVIIMFIFFVVIDLFTDTIVAGVAESIEFGSQNYIPGSLYLLYIFMIMIPLLSSVFLLIRNYIYARREEDKKFSRIMFLSTVAFAGVVFVNSVIVPMFSMQSPRIVSVAVIFLVIVLLISIVKWNILGVSLGLLSVKTKIFFSIFIFCLGLFSVLIIVAYFVSNLVMKSQSMTFIDLLYKGKNQDIDNYVENYVRDIKKFSSDGEIVLYSNSDQMVKIANYIYNSDLESKTVVDKLSQTIGGVELVVDKDFETNQIIDLNRAWNSSYCWHVCEVTDNDLNFFQGDSYIAQNGELSQCLIESMSSCNVYSNLGEWTFRNNNAYKIDPVNNLYTSIFVSKTDDNKLIFLTSNAYLSFDSDSLYAYDDQNTFANNLDEIYDVKDTMVFDVDGTVDWSLNHKYLINENVNSNIIDSNFWPQFISDVVNSKESIIQVNSYIDGDFSDVFVIGYPIVRDDRVVKIIAVVEDTQEIENIIAQNFDERDDLAIYLLNSDGSMLYSSSNRFISHGYDKSDINEFSCDIDSDVSSNQYSRSGDRIWGICGFDSILNTYLIIEYRLSLSFLGPSWSAYVMILFISVASLCISSLSNFIGNYISAPIKDLENGCKKLLKGDFSHEFKSDSQDEIGQLYQSFGKLSGYIHQTQDEINAKIKEQTRYIENQKNELENNQKELSLLLKNVQTEKVKALKERNTMNAILFSIGDGVFVIDQHFKIVMFNKKAEDISGFSLDDVLGKRYDEVLKFLFEKSRSVNDNFIKNAISAKGGKYVDEPTVLIKKNGTEIAVSNSAAPIKNKAGKKIGYVIVFRDVSREREVDRMKSEFVSVASHQLRTPLTGMKWYIELLAGNNADKLNNEQMDFIRNIRDNNERMISLVDDLLNVTRVESNKNFEIKRKKVDVVSILDKVLKIQNVIGTINKVKVSLDSSIPEECVLNVDPDKIFEVFNNVINNAVKYSRENGIVLVGMKEDSKTVTFWIKDRGYGIPKDVQKRIFTQFFRAENVIKRATEGTGLGLYIVKSIMDAHCGKVYFKSVENKGSTFFLSFTK